MKTQFVRSAERQIVKLPPGSPVSVNFRSPPCRELTLANKSGAGRWTVRFATELVTLPDAFVTTTV